MNKPDTWELVYTDVDNCKYVQNSNDLMFIFSTSKEEFSIGICKDFKEKIGYDDNKSWNDVISLIDNLELWENIK